MKKILYILLLISQLCSAQGEAELFVSNDYESGQGVRLKWVFEYLYHPEGFNIHRSSDGSNWDKMNQKPIQLAKNLPEGHSLAKEEHDLYKAVVATPYPDMRKNIIRAFVLIKSIYDNNLAEYVGIAHHDKTALQGTKYTYKLSLVTQEGDIELTKSKEILCSTFSKPLPPEDIQLNRKKKFITFNWKPDLYRYYGVDIYKKAMGEAEFEKITTTGPRAIQPKSAKNYSEASIFFVDTNIVYETGYLYKFVAVDYFNQRSEMSKEIAAPIKDFIPPQMPHSLKLRPSALTSKVSVEWNAIDEADLAGYYIYRGYHPDSSLVRITEEILPKTIKNYTDENVTVGGYYYSVSSADLAGNETSSGLMFCEMRDVEPPAAPQNMVAKSESGKITLSWSANTESDLKGYFVQKSLNDKDNSDNHYINVNHTPLIETEYVEKLAINIKNKFVYRVVAVDTNFNRSKPSVNSLAQMPDVVAPKAPVIKNVALESANARVEWLKNVDTDLGGYNLFRSLVKDSLFYELVNVSPIKPESESYLDRRTEKGNSYVYVLEAFDQTGNKSKYSNSFKIKVPKDKLKDSIVITKSVYNSKKKQVVIQWNSPKYIKMKGYVVYGNDSGTLKPLTGLSEYTEMKLKKELTLPLEIEIRGYTETGDIIKSETILINNE